LKRSDLKINCTNLAEMKRTAKTLIREEYEIKS